MGMLWAVLMPALIICAGLVVRYAFAMVSGKSLVLLDLTSVAVKAAPWAFFVASIRFGTSSLVSNTNLVTKIYLPRLVFPLAAVFSQFFDFLIAAAVFSKGSFLLAINIRLQPEEASAFAYAAPSPSDAPATSAVAPYFCLIVIQKLN